MPRNPQVIPGHNLDSTFLTQWSDFNPKCTKSGEVPIWYLVFSYCTTELLQCEEMIFLIFMISKLNFFWYKKLNNDPKLFTLFLHHLDYGAFVLIHNWSNSAQSLLLLLPKKWSALSRSARLPTMLPVVRIITFRCLTARRSKWKHRRLWMCWEPQET